MLQGKHILIGVTGSISAYKICDLIQRLKEKGAEVRVAVTPSAAKIAHPNAFAALTGSPVIQDAWLDVSHGAIRHIELARWAELFVIAPCTAHTLAELSLGLTGSVVSMTALAYKGSLIVAPAMNTVMLESAPVREHLHRLSERGVYLLPTAKGELACGEVGEGKLITPEEIVAYVDLIASFGNHAPFIGGKKILISGGHTEEPLDGVRFLANRSSGKTAIAMARAFHLAGADVEMVLGVSDEPVPAGVRVHQVRSSAEFLDSMRKGQQHAEVIIMAAAIADFIPAPAETGKWKDSRSMKTLELHPAPNILNELGLNKLPGQILVGFALETDSPMARALEKMKARHCDFMVVNTPLSGTGHGFGEDRVAAAILSDEQTTKELVLKDKNELAIDLVRVIAARLNRKAS